MRQPWRTLRALGIYKPENSEWGWDLPTMASMRLVNQAYGYYRHELDELIEKGGMSFVPKILHAKVTEEEGWHHYYMNTFENCKSALKILNLGAIGCFLACCLLFDGMTGRFFRNSTHGSATLRSLRRILLTHGLVILAAHGLWVRLCNSTWATKVTRGKLYNLGSPLEEAEVRGTLPSLPDALLETRYNSEYLGSYNHMLDVTHPGNRHFHELVKQNSVGYDKLSPSLQRHLSSSILDLQRLSGGRFLTQNEIGTWYEMSADRQIDTVHKELMKASNDVVATVLTELDFLLSETKFGYLRDTALHREHTPIVLQGISHQILYPTRRVDHMAGITSLVSIIDASLSAMRHGIKEKGEERDELIFLLQNLRSELQEMKAKGAKLLLTTVKASPSRSLPTIRALAVRKLAPVEPYKSKLLLPRLPPRHGIGEPYEGAWLAEGDLVDAKYQGRYDWYMARVVSADTDSATYDVMHLDGEIDSGLRRGFIRPYSPPDVGEVVEVRRGSDTYHQATILHMNDDDTCVVQVHDSSIRRTVPLHFLRRLDPVYKEGTRVEVCQFYGRETDGYDDDDNWMPARILQEKDGLYDLILIGYAAGVQKDVPHERLRPYVP
jgi:hypothetical protein